MTESVWDYPRPPRVEHSKTGLQPALWGLRRLGTRTRRRWPERYSPRSLMLANKPSMLSALGFTNQK